jgi:peroxiredoxin
MKRTFLFLAVVVCLLIASALFGVRIGEAAPDFNAVDSRGSTHRLLDSKGRFVVLEWHNQGCPYTQKHYQSGNMQRLQKEWTARGVVWYTVISSAQGQQGFVTAQQENDYLQRMNASPTAALLDPTGQIGHLYTAKTTPHMFVINPAGVLVYEGAIDDKPTTDQSDIATAKNFVSLALQEATSGKPVSTPTSRPYGCSVKYAN